jgi:hypothetical protein
MMKKSTLRAFGIGLFLAGVGLQLLNNIGSTDSNSINSEESFEQTQKELTDVKQQLAQLQIDLENAQKEPLQEATKPAQEESSHNLANTALEIKSGMTSSDIGAWLENAGIIKHKQDFEDYLTAHNMTASIQTGKFEVNPSMTIKQIADSITRKP